MSESGQPDDDGPPTSPTGEIRADYDWSEVTPSTAAIEPLAIVLNRDPTMLDALYDSVDPDAFDTLVSSDGNSAPGAVRSIRFTHRGHAVRVDFAGTVVSRQAEPHGE